MQFLGKIHLIVYVVVSSLKLHAFQLYPLLLTRWMYFMSWIVLHNHVATHFSLILAGFVDYETCCHRYCFFTDISSSQILPLRRYCFVTDIASSQILLLHIYCFFTDIASSHILLLHKYCFFTNIDSSQISLQH